MDANHLRAWWSHRQGLDGSLMGRPPAEVLARTGWARSVGGSNPYLTVFARAGTSREEADRAVASLEIHETPSARGCTYVVPRSDFALALSAARAVSKDSELKLAIKLGATEKEIERLCDKVLKAVENEPLGPDELRDRLGAAVRNFGPEGTKKGLTTTLPIALGKLQLHGSIRRIPVNGRLDQQRYKYTAWRPNPMESYNQSPEQTMTAFARRYFEWIGPATVAEFQWFSGLGAKAAKAAIEPLKLSTIDKESGRLLLPEDVDAFHSFKPPSKPHFVLAASIDGLLLLRRDLQSVADTDDAVNAISGLADLESHAIFDRGRLVGLWEFDPDGGSIVSRSFIGQSRAMDEAIARTEAWIRAELGDVRSFSLDSPKSRKPRIEALRAGY
jgi:hypothetical protein